MRARSLFAAAFVASVLWGTVARADEQSDLEKARAAYLGHQFVDAEARLRAMLDPMHGTVHEAALVTQARMYLAAVLQAQGKKEEAGAVLGKLLLDDPQYEPDPLSFPTDVIDLFIDTRTSLREKLNEEAERRARFEAAERERAEEKKRREAERVANLERIASEESVTTVHSRWAALVPFGVGQFQNGKTRLGWIFLGAEAICVVGMAVTVPLYLADLQSRSDAYRAGDDFAAQEYINRAYTVFYANLAFVGVFAATSVIGVLEAQVNYVPTVVEVKHRAIPQASTRAPSTWSVAPLAAPSPDGHGASFGLTGRF
jgi:tetratricopeptide (TPR) repeat protein